MTKMTKITHFGGRGCSHITSSGRVGVQEPLILADVICEQPLYISPAVDMQHFAEHSPHLIWNQRELQQLNFSDLKYSFPAPQPAAPLATGHLT